MADSITTPVLLLVFNRPATTRRVLESIRAVRPPQLYVAADGPRGSRAEERALCEAARRAATAVDWDCEVATLFRDENLGCGLAVSQGISWFFENVNEGIVLEDDCVPHQSFYAFCQQLLNFYRDEPRVMHISGNSHQYGRRRGTASYYISRYANMWGWATWRRAWNAYDFGLRPAWELDDTWDTQWQLSIEKSDGLAVVPNVNLVQNIGFGSGATHTKGNERPALLGAGEMAFPLTHPASLAPDRAADRFTYYVHHRMVRHPSAVWLYDLKDRIYLRLKGLKRTLFGAMQRRA
jgi:hypothetical protein